LTARGFNLLWPLSEPVFDRACAPVAPALTLRVLLPLATSAIVVASGGRDFFAAFRRVAEATDGHPHPLDRFTRTSLEEAVRTQWDDGRGRPRVAYRLFFPFVSSLPALPFQRLGRAAGLGAPGPLGLQIHPHYGPWWAYRAVIVVADESVPAPSAPPPRSNESPPLSSGESLGDGCAGCDAPCVAACPGGAVRRDGFSVVACHAHRLVAPPCQLSCVARIRCVRGPAQRYTDEQLAFHMAASMPLRRA
jgi:epoxyqueuosine reductase